MTWDYDLKRKLLGSNYNHDKPIKNILLAQDDKNYEDKTEDYFKYNRYKRGHLENYLIVEEAFRKLYASSSERKDIMNSFWTTYKFLLQFEYPDIFTPIGKIGSGIPFEKRNNDFREFEKMVSNREKYAPQKGFVPQEYIEYYKENFPKLKVIEREMKTRNKKNQDSIFGITWEEFLLDNFDYFDKVHNQEDLKTFAKRTHTIGNIDIVPKGFNAGRNNSDYWDWGLQAVKEFLDTISSLVWKTYIDVHQLNDYMGSSYVVKPFWENHLDSSDIIPKKRDDIIKFLETVNNNIENRGKKILLKIGE